ncbi:type II toxin-antitoxin system VapC family toxin [Algoriphagus oliviformis]|uniref:type II toxin-antitoxin system VapC family toxin n=1 Tax=Algoriphagus oliviformis TaxID=2811231 RepID=UPI00293D361C|nr:type II toxin-antitoxin system VapC family toxin [Algoriphagus oliviformis]
MDLISDKELVLSVITEIELLSFPLLTDENKEQIRNLLNECIVLDLDQEIKELTIDFRKKYRIKLPDSIIAASAYTSKAPLLTGDKEFRKIEELNLLIYEF